MDGKNNDQVRQEFKKKSNNNINLTIIALDLGNVNILFFRYFRIFDFQEASQKSIKPFFFIKLSLNETKSIFR